MDPRFGYNTWTVTKRPPISCLDNGGVNVCCGAQPVRPGHNERSVKARGSVSLQRALKNETSSEE